MNWRRLISFLALSIMGTSCYGQSSPEIDRNSLPSPPSQNQRWTPPSTKLPANVISACQDLFDSGLADPRGCEYREVIVSYRKSEWSPAGNADELKTHGWILPARDGESERYAICWDGLVYQVQSVGVPADLDADIQKMLAQNVDPGPQGMRQDPSSPSPIESLAVDQFALIKLPLLLRLGRVDLAEGVWNHLQAWIKASRWNEDELKQEDPFVFLSHEWLRSSLARALDAHVRGDARLALACLQPMPGMRKKVEDATAKRSAALPKNGQDFQLSFRLFDLKSLNQVPVLIEDEQRRIKENGLNDEAPDKITDKKQRITRLIHDLENVQAYSMMMPGYIEFGMDSTVMALIKEGEDAVDPLLDCLENDHRLTRSLDTGIRVTGVEEPAFAALQGIFKSAQQFSSLQEPYVNMHPGGPLLERGALAAQVRAYWNTVRGTTQPERWYATLLNDKAKPDAWAEAASDIVLPDDAQLFSGWGVMMTCHNPDAPVHFWGEVLRSKTNPSVSDLLIKRLKEGMTAKDSKAPFPLEAPKKLAIALAKWDGKNQLDTLKWYCDELQKIVQKETDNNGPGEIQDLISTYLRRHELGDSEAFNEYAQWLRAADAQKLNKLAQLYGAFYLSPVWSYPDDPAMVSLSKWLFEDPKSSWTTGPGGIDPDWIATSVHTPLESIPAFRALILHALRDKKVVGSVEVTPTNIMVQYHYGSGDLNDDPEAVVGTKMPVRLCDFIASRISRYRGAPRFETYWPEARRDSVIEDTIIFLKRYGNQLSYKTTADDDAMGYPFPDDLPHLLTLDHPASNQEAATGLAIFSLEGKGDRRVFKLPNYPFRANWITLKDRAVIQNLRQADGTMTKTTVYPQEGLIWQAEDVSVDGKWQRFYGYSGCGHIEAVPADQIEFVPADGFDPMGDGWGFSVNLHGDDNYKWERPVPDIKPGQPFPLTIGIKNLRGNDRPLPAGAPASGSILAQDADIKITVSFTPHTRNEAVTFPPNPAVKWEDLVPKAPVQVDVLPLPAILAPLEGKTYLRLDLAKSYDFSAPGTYRVKFQFIKNSPFYSEYGHLPMDFEVTSKN
jgi:hypothetical protein